MLRVLVLDSDPGVIEDYSLVFGTSSVPACSQDAPCDNAIDQVLVPARPRRGFPAIALATFRRGPDAVEAVRQAVAERARFAVAFIDVSQSPGLEGLRTAEDLRMLDPELHIVLVSARGDLDPVELSARIAPADRLFLVQKPFQGAELQQLLLALGRRWREEERFAARGAAAQAPLGDWTGLTSALESLPAAAMVFDRQHRLVSASPAIALLLPEMVDVVVPGIRYQDLRHELERRLVAETVPAHGDIGTAAGLGSTRGFGELVELKLTSARWILLAGCDEPSGRRLCLLFDVSALKRHEARRTAATVMAEMRRTCAALYALLERRLAQPTGGTQKRAGGSGRSKAAVLPCGPRRDKSRTDLRSLLARVRAVAEPPVAEAEALVLDRVIPEVVRERRGDWPADIEFEVVSGIGLWPVRVDRTRFEMALLELVANACQAMPQGGRVTLETANVRLGADAGAAWGGSAAKDYIRLSVRDTGPGMADDVAERAFLPFFTAGGDGARAGLGLSLVHGFATLSGGYIELDGGGDGNAPARGATFNLYLPREVAKARGSAGDRGVARCRPKGLVGAVGK